MIIYTLLFTLKDKDPKNNRYVNMFCTWLVFLLAHGELTSSDKLVVLIDKPTLDYLESSQFMGDFIMTLLEDVPFEFLFEIIPSPSTLTEGIVERYKFKKITQSESEVYVFFDLDICILNPFKHLFEDIPKPFIYYMPEGHLLDNDYAGQTVSHTEVFQNRPGLSAGWFAFSSHPDVQTCFTKIAHLALQQEQTSTPFYTLDQPFFNKVMYEDIILRQMDGDTIPNFFLNPELFTNNTYNCAIKDLLFMNFCGEPGNDMIHYEKMVKFLGIQYLALLKRRET